MKTLIQAAVVTLFAASAAQAQQAVQWKVSDGGNGHWYQLSVTGPITWPVAKSAAEVRGGHLATLTSDAEKRFAQAVVAAVPGFGESAVRRWGPWLGGFQDRTANDYSEPRSGWRWITGESWSYVAWLTYQPDNWCAETRVEEDFLSFAGYYLQGDGAWNDLPSDGCDNDPVVSYVIEWSTDCNGDGIVDYGQCRDGSLPDFNGNNIPDCCESGTACVVGNYPVQWRVEDGGNGHWYQVRQLTTDCWDQSRLLAQGSGGYLATIASAGENQLIHLIVQTFYGSDVSIGGYYDFESNSWRWVSGETWQYSNWQAGEPGCCLPNEWWLDFNMVSGEWRDRIQCIDPPQPFPAVALFEWSADCNNDGIVDYGHILQGQLADANADGVPDICQQPTCVDADFFRDFTVNGADLGILLSQWGSNTPLTVSDLNGDGGVDGADLGLFLSFWGACP